MGWALHHFTSTGSVTSALCVEQKKKHSENIILVKNSDGSYENEQTTLISGMTRSRWSLNKDTYYARALITFSNKGRVASHTSLSLLSKEQAFFHPWRPAFPPSVIQEKMQPPHYTDWWLQLNVSLCILPFTPSHLMFGLVPDSETFRFTDICQSSNPHSGEWLEICWTRELGVTACDFFFLSLISSIWARRS